MLTQQPTPSLIHWSAVTVVGSRSTAARCRDGRWCNQSRSRWTNSNITVRATSADGSFTDQAYTIAINDVDEFDVGSVSDTDATTNAVNENATIGTTVGITASASDADATTNGITYSLANDDGGRFTINSSTGVVPVAGAINREADGPTRNIIVRATSADGSFTDQAYTIAINDVDEFDVGSVSDTDATANAVNENAAIGTTVGITPQPLMLTQRPTDHLLVGQCTTVVASRSTAVRCRDCRGCH